MCPAERKLDPEMQTRCVRDPSSGLEECYASWIQVETISVGDGRVNGKIDKLSIYIFK